MEPSPEALQPEMVGERLKVGEIRRSRNVPLRFTGQYFFDDLKTEGPAVCDWDIQLEATGFVVYGKLVANVVQECARCLEPFTTPVSVNIEEHYVFQHFVDYQEREKELLSEDFYEVVSEDGELDLKDLAHQWLVLESENHPACGRAECRFA